MEFKQNVLNFIFRNRCQIAGLYFYLLFWILPIKKNKIVFQSQLGSGYSCNPKYITEEFLKQKLPVEIVWLTRKMFMDSESFPKGVKVVDYDDINKAFFELATAKVWISNIRFNNLIKKGLRKKKGQIYLNTWHGSLGIKRIGSDAQILNNNKEWETLAHIDSDYMDYMVSNSDFESDVYRNAVWFKNKILEFGHPRNDVFFVQDNEFRNSVLEKLGIEKDTKIVLYVPSHRDTFRTSCFNIDYEGVTKKLEEKTGDKWKVLSKFHTRNIHLLDKLTGKNPYQHDVTMYHDVQDLLRVADIIISDYSSCMFDYMLTRKPCFIFATDIKEFNNERGFYYPLETTPFPIAENNEQLVKNIENFDSKTYQEEVDKFLNKMNCIDDGMASNRVVNYLKNLLKI